MKVLPLTNVIVKVLTEARKSSSVNTDVNSLLPNSGLEIIRHQTEAAKHKSLYDKAQTSIHNHIRRVAEGSEKLNMDNMESWFKDSKHHSAMVEYHNKMAKTFQKSVRK